MIIDVHGHYTTAPAALAVWRHRQIAGSRGPSFKPEPPASRSPTTRSARRSPLASSRLLQRARHRSDAVFARRAGGMAHHYGDRDHQRALDDDLQRPHPSGLHALPRQLRRGDANCRSRRACRPTNCIAELDDCVRGIRRSSASTSIPIRPTATGRTAAHRSMVVPAVREAGRARRAGDDPRVDVVQSKLPRHWRALPQRRHDRVHAARPGATCSRTSRRCGSSSRTVAARCRTTGVAIAASAQDAGWPPIESLLSNVFFDTCVYHHPGVRAAGRGDRRPTTSCSRPR